MAVCAKLFVFRYQVISRLNRPTDRAIIPDDLGPPATSAKPTWKLGQMGNFEEISRQLGNTFAELENAQGKAKRRCLRKAHLLLLLADEMIAEACSRVSEQPAADPACNDDILHKRALWRVFTEVALRSTERGPCRGLQSVLVLRRP